VQNLEYGAYAPGAPDVFIDEAQFKSLWLSPARCYLLAKESLMDRLVAWVGAEKLNIVTESGGKLLLVNQPVPGSSRPELH